MGLRERIMCLLRVKNGQLSRRVEGVSGGGDRVRNERLSDKHAKEKRVRFLSLSQPPLSTGQFNFAITKTKVINDFNWKGEEGNLGLKNYGFQSIK